MIKEHIEKLYAYPRFLLGQGYHDALTYINSVIPLELINVPSGTNVGAWEVPKEWVIRDAWVKFNNQKIIDFKENPMAVADYSVAINKKIGLEELKKHLYISDERPNALPYSYKFYSNSWGFNMPKNKVMQLEVKNGMICENGICVPDLKKIDPSVGKVIVEGVGDKYKDLLQEGEYEVFIDSELKPGIMEIGIHTIKGKSNREILLFAHLDHPYQANDNLSSVACLMDMAEKIKDKYEHTVKLIFCPETIGSIAYGATQDLSNVDFTISLECIGIDNPILFQKAFDLEAKINRVTHLALQNAGEDYKKGNFRQLIGSDEYYFNDPLINIPSVLLSRWATRQGNKSYAEYHTSDDIPLIIKEDMILRVQEVVMKIIEIWERDFVPVKKFKGPLMRSKHSAQTPYADLNLSYDHFFYGMDGKRSIAEMCAMLGLNFEYTMELMDKLLKDNLIKKYEQKNSRSYGRKKAK